MRRWWLWIIILLVVAAFLPVLSNDFVEYDDGVWLVRNSLIQPPTWDSLLRIWYTPFLGLYVPVPMSIWHTLAHFARAESTTRIAALDPAWFHSASLTAHLLATAGVGLLARRLFAGSVLAGAAAAAWYGLHPTQVEAVAWASGLKDVVSAAFYVWSLWAMTRYFQCDSGRRLWLVAAAALACLAMLSKPAAVMLPAAWGILWLWHGRPPVRPALAAAVVTGCVASLAVAWVTHEVQPVSHLTLQPTWLQRLQITADTLGHYLQKCLWPTNLTLDYGRAPTWVLAEGRWIGRAVAAGVACTVVGVAGLFSGVGKCGRGVALGCGLAVAGIFPVLGFTGFAFQEASTVTDHYMMPGHIGVALAVAALAVGWATHRGTRGLAVVCAVITAGFLALTYEQAGRWRDNATLFAHAVRVSPNPTLALNNLAATGRDLSSHEALAIYRRALANRPTYAQPWGNISQLLLGKGDIAGALDAAERAIRLEPKAYELRKIRADALLAAGRRDEAIAELRFALERNPKYRDAQRLLDQVTTMPTTVTTTMPPTTAPNMPHGQPHRP